MGSINLESVEVRGECRIRGEIISLIGRNAENIINEIANLDMIWYNTAI